MTKVKLCGITRFEDAHLAAGLGADYLGFIQYARSARYLPPEAAAAITAGVPGPVPVGVFVDAAVPDVLRACATAGFRVAQLHGDEPPEACAAVRREGVRVVKAFRVRPGAAAAAVREAVAPYAGAVDGVLLDAYHALLHGGTGTRFDWRVARALAAEHRLFLAGGVGGANVAEAVANVAPYAVDLSSAVERAPGQKCPVRLWTFFRAFRGASLPLPCPTP